MKNNQNYNHYSSRHFQKKLNYFLQKKWLLQRNIWALIVLARFLYFLTLLLSYYHERF
jgi:hypothetical protein